MYTFLDFPICIGGQYSNIMELNFKPAQWLQKINGNSLQFKKKLYVASKPFLSNLLNLSNKKDKK